MINPNNNSLEEKEEKKTSTFREICKLITYFLIVFIFFVVVIVFYQQYEGWDLTDTIFFVIVTISTVGKDYYFSQFIKNSLANS